MDLGDVLDGMFRLGREHWRAFSIGLGLVLIPLALLSSLAVTAIVGPTPPFSELLSDPEAADEFAFGDVSQQELQALVGTAVLSSLASIALTPLVWGTAVHVAATGHRDGTADGMASLRAAGRRYLSLLGTTVLVFVLPGVVLLVAPVLAAALGAAGLEGGVVGLVLGLGGLVGLVVAVIVAVRVMLAVPVVVVEQAGPIGALNRSNELVRGRTGVLLGSVIVVLIITTIIQFVLGVPFTALAGLQGGAVGATASTLGQIVTGIVQNALLGAAFALFYFDRRVRKEGYDLSQLADELGQRRPHDA
jgi:hypothetical protein